MSKRAFMLVFALAGIAATQLPAANDGWVVRPEGAGPVKIGMTIAQINAALSEKFALPAEKDERGCFFVSPSRHPDFDFMIENGRLVRIDVAKPGVATVEGIQVGDSEARAKSVYGSRLKVEPHAYNGPEGHYLTVRSKDGRYGTRFETDGGKIQSYYAGLYSAVQYIEGCE